MTIDFNTMPFETIAHFKGGEKEIRMQTFFDKTHRISHGILPPGASIGTHKHEHNSEVLFILSGEGTIIEDGVSSSLHAGQCSYCPEGHTHSLLNTGESNLEFYCVVPSFATE